MKKSSFIFMALFVAGMFFPGSILAAQKAPAGYGQTYEEIVELAQKEGKVRFASSDPEEKREKAFFKPFVDKYGIKVEYSRARGTESRERILLELMSGMVDYDLLHISEELITKYKQAGALEGPFDWEGLFKVNPIFIDPEKYMIAAGATLYFIAYNKDMVPEERIPRRWEDFLDPYWTGRFVVDTRPRAFTGLIPGWGEEKVLKYARALAANKPIWKRGQTATLAEVAAGEYAAFNGAYASSIFRILRRDPNTRLTYSVPKEVSSDHYCTAGILKGAKNRNAALLLAGWLVSDEGQKQYDVVIDRGSPLVKTKMTKLIKDAGATLIFSGWEFTPEDEAESSKKVSAAFGFPTAKKKKKK